MTLIDRIKKLFRRPDAPAFYRFEVFEEEDALGGVRYIAEPVPSVVGRWVRRSDYQALEKRVQKAEAKVLEFYCNSDVAVEEIARLKDKIKALSSSYGDNWFDGYMDACDDQRAMKVGSITDYSESEILVMSEKAEEAKNARI